MLEAFTSSAVAPRPAQDALCFCGPEQPCALLFSVNAGAVREWALGPPMCLEWSARLGRCASL